MEMLTSNQYPKTIDSARFLPGDCSLRWVLCLLLLFPISQKEMRSGYRG